MKTVSKKLLSLLLVAMLLVSAVPQAFAAEAIIRYGLKLVATVDGETQTFTLPTGAGSEEEYKSVAGMSVETILEIAQEEGKLTDIDLETAEIDGEGEYKDGVVTFTVTITTEAEEEEPEDEPEEEPEDETEEEPSTVTVTLTVYDKNDERVESKTAEVEAADFLAWQDDVMDNIEDILDAFGSAYSASEVDSGFASNKQVVLKLKVAGSPAEGDNVVAGVILKTDYCGNIPAKVGQKYSDVLPTPAKPGQEFAYWYSENLKGRVKAGSIIEGDDVLTAIWQAPTEYTLTFIDERGTEPDVVLLRKIAYGSAIGTLPVPADRDGYIFVGWKLDATGKYITAETIYEFQGDTTAYAQWKLESDTEGEAMGGTNEKDGKVYLEIYINGDTETLKKRVDITSYAADDKITRAEVQTVVKKYITAKAGYTLSYEGLFDDPLWWEYKHDPETNGKETIVVNRDGDDYVFVMVKNVKVVAADPSNPKTGDYVLSAAMTMMMVSGLAAAAVYVIGKKRRV